MSPLAHSSTWRAQGCIPISIWGLVIWLTSTQYADMRALDEPIQPTDATDEQIAAQDRWYDEAMDSQRREMARLFRETTE